MKKLNTILIAVICTVIFIYSCKKEKEKEIPCKQPDSPTATNNSPVSIGSTINLSASGAPAGGTYNWYYKSNPNANPATVTVLSFAYKKGNEGDYYVTVTSGGCTSEATHTYVTSAEVTISGDSVVETGKPIKLFASSILNSLGQVIPASYSWSGPNGFTSSIQNPTTSNATMASAGTYSVTATITGSGVTSQVATRSVTVRPAAPIVTITGSATTTVGGTLNLTASTTNAGATNFKWTGPNGYTSNVQNPVLSNITRANAGKYSATYELNGITSSVGTTTKTVVVNFSKTGCSGQTTLTWKGKTYNAVEIGNQCWMKENLLVSGVDTIKWSDATESVILQQGACPTGWHVPNDSMWRSLSLIVNQDGNALKAVGQGDSITLGPGTGTNTSGFSATGIPTVLNSKKNNPPANYSTSFWSFSEVNEDVARIISLYYHNNLIYFDTTPKAEKYVVRCIKD